MAGLQTRHSPCDKSLPTNKDDLTKSAPKTLTDASNTIAPTSTLAASWAQYLITAILALALIISSTNKLYEQQIKIYTARLKFLE